MKHKNVTLGIVSILVLSVFLGFMGVVARNLTELSLFQQVYGRTLLAAIIIVPFYLKQLHPSVLKQLPTKDILLATARGVIYYIGVVLVSYAALNTELFVATTLSSLPFAAVFGIVLINEKLNFTRMLSLIAALVGVFTMQGLWQADVSFGLGELAAIISSVLFGLTYVARKWQSDEISNSQQTSIMLTSGGLIVLLFSIVTLEATLPLFDITNATLIWLLFGGILNAFLLLLTNYGFSNVPALVGDILLKTTFLFSFIFGFIIYNEGIETFELLGGAIILAGTIMLSYSENKQRL